MFVPDRKKRIVPVPCLVCWGLGAVGAVVHLLCRFLPAVADAVNRYPANWVRTSLAAVTSVLPFSLAEWLVLLIPVWIGLVIFFAVRFRRTRESRLRFLAGLLAVVSVLYFCFVFTLGCGYFTSPLAGKIGLKREKTDSAALAETALFLARKAEENAPERTGGATEMPFDLSVLNENLLAAYADLGMEYDFLPVFRSCAKSLLCGRAMCYTNITGVYFFLTGEANISAAYPDYTLPFTMAHELSHQRGIAREDEANFMAFLVCARSDQPYIRYSGYLNLLEYVLSALYRADADRYRETVQSLAPVLREEIAAYRTFAEQYRNDTVASVSDAVNNGYLILNGTEGTVSYGLVAELAVAYWRAAE